MTLSARSYFSARFLPAVFLVAACAAPGFADPQAAPVSVPAPAAQVTLASATTPSGTTTRGAVPVPVAVPAPNPSKTVLASLPQSAPVMPAAKASVKRRWKWRPASVTSIDGSLRFSDPALWSAQTTAQSVISR